MNGSSRRPDVTRRGFISDVAIGAGGALALGGLIRPEAAAAEAYEAESAAWDMSWVDRLTGKYRAVFDTPDFNDGTVFVNATVFMAGFQEVYGVGDADTQAVLVIRHTAIPMIFNDAMWEKYALAEAHKIPNAEKRNPWTGQFETMRGRGAIVLACNLAANRLGGQVARRVSADPAAVRAEMFANVLPGVTLMPNGVFAAIRAQQAGCSFMKSA